MADKKISQLDSVTTPLAGTETLPVVQSSTTKKVTVANLTAGRTVTMSKLNSDDGALGRWTLEQGASTNNIQSTTTGFGDWKNATLQASGSGVNMTWNTAGNTIVGVGNLIIGTAGKGIDFSANTAAAGMTSELLSWYEEGTWTPTVIGTTTAGTATYSTQLGTYTRIGRMVYFQLELNWNSGTGAGQLRLSGLPFTCGSSNCAVSIGDVENIALTALYYMAGAYVFANSTQISLRECQVGGGGNNPVTYDAAGIIRVGGCYYV